MTLTQTLIILAAVALAVFLLSMVSASRRRNTGDSAAGYVAFIGAAFFILFVLALSLIVILALPDPPIPFPVH